jgi:cytidylate kinase
MHRERPSSEKVRGRGNLNMVLIERSTRPDRAAWLAERRMRQWTLGLETQRRQQPKPSTSTLLQEIHPCLTISREAGAGGALLARRLGEILRKDVLDREILDDMARRYNVPRDMLDFVDEKTSNWTLEIFGKWLDRRVVTQSEYIVHLGQIVLLAARSASAIFVGRGAQFVLPTEKTLKVYLVGPLSLRIAHVCETRSLSQAEAKRYVHETDKGRRVLVKRYFNREIGDPHLYDLIINRAYIDLNATAELIAGEWRRRFAD